MSGPSKLQFTLRACDERYRQNAVWLWEEILFSIEWYHLIPFMTIRYWCNAVWTWWKMHFGPNLNSHKTKRKQKWNIGQVKIWILFHGIIIIKNIQDISTDRFWNRLKWYYVRSEQVAGHVSSVWWTISPIWGTVMKGKLVLYRMIPSNPFHDYPLLI